MEKLHASLHLPLLLGVLLASLCLTGCNASNPAKGGADKSLREVADTALMSSHKLSTAEVDAIMVSYSVCRAKDYQ